MFLEKATNDVYSEKVGGLSKAIDDFHEIFSIMYLADQGKHKITYDDKQKFQVTTPDSVPVPSISKLFNDYNNVIPDLEKGNLSLNCKSILAKFMYFSLGKYIIHSLKEIPINVNVPEDFALWRDSQGKSSSRILMFLFPSDLVSVCAIFFNRPQSWLETKKFYPFNKPQIKNSVFPLVFESCKIGVMVKKPGRSFTLWPFLINGQ